jgi:hypothetical protein
MARCVLRWAAATVAATALTLWPLGPAGAEFTENTIGCSGSAVLTDPGGTIWPITAVDAEAKVPREGTASWQGSISTVTHNHRGDVALEIGFWDVTIRSWGPSPNSRDENARMGRIEIPSIVRQVPPGKYVVSGFHEGDEGACAGQVVIDVQGSPFTTAAGIVSLAGTVLSGAAVAVAGRAKGA